MQVNSGLAGIIIAIGFVVLGLVSMPTLAPVFLVGAVLVGLAVAIILRVTAKD